MYSISNRGSIWNYYVFILFHAHSCVKNFLFRQMWYLSFSNDNSSRHSFCNSNYININSIYINISAGVVIINHTSHLHSHWMWADFQLISTWLNDFLWLLWFPPLLKSTFFSMWDYVRWHKLCKGRAPSLLVLHYYMLATLDKVDLLTYVYMYTFFFRELFLQWKNHLALLRGQTKLARWDLLPIINTGLNNIIFNCKQ